MKQSLMAIVRATGIGSLMSVIIVAILTGCVSTSAPQPGEKSPYHKPSEYLPIGFVSTVNVVENFIVINFSSSVMPRVGDELKIYRAGRPVGSVRITEPLRPPLATADILAGEPQRGDAIRP
ncbi:hypothetical protein QPK87_09110 [Kamptonema cortianum]|nr:hypothetical protein [Kamptonema cortianum]MDL5046193.1 hypothetical protein [Oscillatoria amoena NRMC-F 0135]